ncbi:MAG: GntR family transcriptional regulator [Chloroflexi bacterium]|nr:GntR family transcriptional regulator [Chloroflexota bacterium]
MLTLKRTCPSSPNSGKQITWLIASGKLKSGDRLPTIRELADQLGVHMHTVRRGVPQPRRRWAGGNAPEPRDTRQTVRVGQACYERISLPVTHDRGSHPQCLYILRSVHQRRGGDRAAVGIHDHRQHHA